VRHDGAANQALLRLTWPTRDDSDFNDVLRLELLERVVRLELTDTLREELGQTYSPGVSASESDVFPGYGTFAISTEVDVAQVDAARAATLALLAGLATKPVDADILLRARQPLLEYYDNALKSNDGWMALVDRAQTEPDQIERFQRAKALLAGLTAEDLRATAARWLKPGSQVEVLVLPRENVGAKTPVKAAAAGE
jgi:zinc protease